mgnify:FL=1
MKVSKTEAKALRVVESYLVVINAVLLVALIGTWVGLEIGKYL